MTEYQRGDLARAHRKLVNAEYYDKRRGKFFTKAFIGVEGFSFGGSLVTFIKDGGAPFGGHETPFSAYLLAGGMVLGVALGGIALYYKHDEKLAKDFRKKHPISSGI